MKLALCKPYVLCALMIDFRWDIYTIATFFFKSNLLPHIRTPRIGVPLHLLVKLLAFYISLLLIIVYVALHLLNYIKHLLFLVMLEIDHSFNVFDFDKYS